MVPFSLKAIETGTWHEHPQDGFDLGGCGDNISLLSA